MHTLKIHSLHDGIASCSCGHWHYACAGATTREHIEEEYHWHLVYHDAEPKAPAPKEA